jgi:hypothetical protein
MIKAGENCLEERKEGRELKIGMQVTHTTGGSLGDGDEGNGVVAQDRGRKGGKRKPGRDSNVVTGAAGGASRRNSPRGAGKPVQLSGTGESKGRCTTDGRAERLVVGWLRSALSWPS